VNGRKNASSRGSLNARESSKAKQETITEKTGKKTVGGKMTTGGYVAGDHDRFVLTLDGKEDTAEAHSSTSLRGLLVGDGSM